MIVYFLTYSGRLRPLSRQSSRRHMRSAPQQAATRLVNMLSKGPRVVVGTTAFHARVRGSVPSLGGLKETEMFPPHPRVKVSIVGSPVTER